MEDLIYSKARLCMTRITLLEPRQHHELLKKRIKELVNFSPNILESRGRCGLFESHVYTIWSGIMFIA